MMAGKLLGALAVVATAVVLVGCGGKQEEQIAPTVLLEASPTAMPTVVAARLPPRAAQSTPEEYRAAMSPLVSEGEQIFHEPSREMREAVAAKIDALRVRIQMIEPPDRWAVSHALMVDSLRQAANGMRGEGIAQTTGDLQALHVASEEQLEAIDGWDEAVRQMPLLELAP